MFYLLSIFDSLQWTGAVALGLCYVGNAYQSLKVSGISIVFNSVTDPYKAGVAKSETDHDGGECGRPE